MNMSEEDIEKFLVKNLHIVEDDMKFLGRQVPVKYGIIDILAKDQNGTKCAIEVKMNVNDAVVSQLARYYISKDKKIRVILVCDHIPKKIRDLCDFFGFETKEIDFSIYFPNGFPSNKKKLPILKKMEIKRRERSCENRENIIKILKSNPEGISAYEISRILIGKEKFSYKKFNRVYRNVRYHLLKLKEWGRIKELDHIMTKYFGGKEKIPFVLTEDVEKEGFKLDSSD